MIRRQGCAHWQQSGHARVVRACIRFAAPIRYPPKPSTGDYHSQRAVVVLCKFVCELNYLDQPISLTLWRLMVTELYEYRYEMLSISIRLKSAVGQFPSSSKLAVLDVVFLFYITGWRLSGPVTPCSVADLEISRQSVNPMSSVCVVEIYVGFRPPLLNAHHKITRRSCRCATPRIDEFSSGLPDMQCTQRIRRQSLGKREGP